MCWQASKRNTWHKWEIDGQTSIKEMFPLQMSKYKNNYNSVMSDLRLISKTEYLFSSFSYTGLDFWRQNAWYPQPKNWHWKSSTSCFQIKGKRSTKTPLAQKFRILPKHGAVRLETCNNNFRSKTVEGASIFSTHLVDIIGYSLSCPLHWGSTVIPRKYWGCYFVLYIFWKSR